jgi:hypothetical protein
MLIGYLNLPQIQRDPISNSLSFELNPNQDNFWRYVGNESLLERMVGTGRKRYMKGISISTIKENIMGFCHFSNNYLSICSIWKKMN